jgi:hypothetical protein
MEVAQLFELDRDGRIIRFQLHQHREDALAEVARAPARSSSLPRVPPAPGGGC